MKLCKKILIITGGTIQNFFVKKLSEQHFDCIMAVDGGLKTAHELNLKIDYLIGDFDTVSPDLLSLYEKQSTGQGGHIIIRRFRPEKDATDTQIAMEEAVNLRPESIFIAGATGKRMDHTLGNIHILKKALDSAIPAYLLDEHNKIYMASKSFELQKEDLYGKYVSLIPFTEQVLGVTLKGFKYPLHDYTLRIGDSIGISNQMIEEKGKVILDKGILLVLETKD